MQPFNTAAELTVLLLLGLMVKPEALVTVLPVGLALALVLPLARLVGVWLVLHPPAFRRGDRLIVAGCGLRAAVPLALAVSLTEELPHLRGITPAAVEPLAAQLLALIADHRKKIAQLEAVVAKRKQEEAALITKFVQASAPPSQPSGPKQITSLESGPPSS